MIRKTADAGLECPVAEEAIGSAESIRLETVLVESGESIEVKHKVQYIVETRVRSAIHVLIHLFKCLGLPNAKDQPLQGVSLILLWSRRCRTSVLKHGYPYYSFAVW